MSGVDDLLAASRAGATHVETGRFRLDWKKALDKIKEFQLTDPHRWVLEIVQAAVAGGATAIDVTTDSDDVVIRFDGQPPEADELDGIFEFLFAADADLMPLRQLALGVNAALGMKPRFIRIDVGDGAAGSRLELSSYEDLKVEPLTDEVPRGVRVHVRDRTSWRRVVEAVKTRTAEGRILEADCRWCPVPITLDGQRLDGDFAAGAAVVHAYTDGPVRGTLALRLGRDGGSRLAICMNGVRVVDLQPWDAADPRQRLGVDVLVDHPGLTRNASHSDFFRDDKWRKMMERVEAELPVLVDLLCERVQAGLQLGESAEFVLIPAAQFLLRSAPATLTGPQRVLLDRLNIVQLATSRPGRATLLQSWEAAQKLGYLPVASRRFDLPLDAVPDGMVPVTGPDWLVELFGVKVVDVDEQLTRLEAGAGERMRRERLRRDPDLWPEEAFVQVPVRDEASQITGEVGLTTELSPSLVMLATQGQDTNRSRGVFAVHCRNGVPLGTRWIDCGINRGVAILDSPHFEPFPDWTDVQSTTHTRAVEPLITGAIPALARALCIQFDVLPPPAVLLEAGTWSAEHGPDASHLPPALAAAWRGDPLAMAARAHIDSMLEATTFDRDRHPWLFAWKLFHLLDGTPVSLDQIAGRAPVGTETVPPEHWRFVNTQPWGGGARDSLRYVNGNRTHRDMLQRQLGRSLPDGNPTLHASRSALFEEAAVARRRAARMAAAGEQRQPAELGRGLAFAVTVDLDVPQGRGQAGLLLGGEPGGTVRVLSGELPLVDLPLAAPFDCRAVLESGRLTPNAAFDGLSESTQELLVYSWVRAAYPKLIAGLLELPGAIGADAIDRAIWAWLEGLIPEEIEAIPQALLDRPLVLLAGGGRATLRELRADVAAHDGTFRWVGVDPGRTAGGRPVATGDNDRRALLRRLVKGRPEEYAEQLDRELAILDRRQGPARPSRLDRPVLVRAPLQADGFDGEVALVAEAPYGTVDVLVSGVFVQHRPLDIDGLPVAAIVSSDRFTPNPSWKKVHSNEVWKAAEVALRDATDQAVIAACAASAEPSTAGAALRTMLRGLCGRRFAGRPQGPLQTEGAVEAALAAAALWETADVDTRRVSLSAIATQARAVGSVWVVDDRTKGHLADGRIVLRRGDGAADAIDAIWGDRARDGSDVLARDDAAFVRRRDARALAPVLTDALEPVSCEATIPDLGLQVRGQVGLALRYRKADAGVAMTVGVDGRELYRVTLDHPLRGEARLDVTGLTANRDWTGPGDPRQEGALRSLVSGALWGSVERVAADRGLTLLRDEDRYAMLIEALAALTASEEHPELRLRLQELPLFGTVDGRALSLTELGAHVERTGAVDAVEDSLPTGRPRDGRMIVHTSREGLALLQRKFAGKLSRCDERWRGEVDGARTFAEAPISTPHLKLESVASLYFQSGSTTGMVGLLEPDDSLGAGDDADGDSVVNLHIGGRPIASHEPDWHPAVEAWVDDVRMTPNGDYSDVVDDQVFRAVMALVEAQIPELVARAAEKRSALEPGVHMRLCRLALDRRDALVAAAKADPRGPQARLLAAPLWPCAAAGSETRRSTTDILAAHAAGTLGTADDEIEGGEPEAGWVVVLASADLLAVLHRGLARLPDRSEDLRASQARVYFRARAAIDRIDLRSTGWSEPHLARHPIEGDGWAGELAVLRERTAGIEVQIHHENRRLATRTIESAVGAAAVAQWTGLQVSPRWDEPAPGDSLTAFELHLRRCAWRMVTALAADAGGSARPALIATLHDAEKESERDPDHAAMVAALRAAPLFSDTHGKTWSVVDLRAQADARPLKSITPETYDGNQWPTPDVVLVISDGDWPAASGLFAVERYDGEWGIECVASLNRHFAPTSHRLPRGRMVETEVRAGDVHGVLALDDDPGPGRIGLLSGGKKVEERELPDMPGLCGWIDGPLATDDVFRSVELTMHQRAEIDRLYDQRLAAAVDLAHEHRRRRGDTWRALGRYVRAYLVRHLGDLGGSFRQRRDAALAPPASLPEAMRKALACPVFLDGEGEWVPLPALLGGDDPRVVVSPARERGLPEGTVAVRGDPDEIIPLLVGLLGSKAVDSADAVRAAAAQSAAARKAEAEDRKQHARRDAIAALRALLREIAPEGGGGLPQSRIRNLELPEDHGFWKDAVAAHLDELPDATALLAAAWLTHALEPDAAVVMLQRLAHIMTDGGTSDLGAAPAGRDLRADEPADG